MILSATLLVFIGSCSSNDSSSGPSQSPDVTTPGVVTAPIDRMGRPGITTALIADNFVKDAYNDNGVPATWSAAFLAPMIERANIIDGFDGTIGNALLTDTTALVSILVDDRLQIDTRTPECNAYLAVEIGLGDCGGRTLDRDVINDTLRHLVSQDMPVDDLADSDNVVLSDWPFFGEPNP